MEGALALAISGVRPLLLAGGLATKHGLGSTMEPPILPLLGMELRLVMCRNWILQFLKSLGKGVSDPVNISSFHSGFAQGGWYCLLWVCAYFVGIV